MPRSIKLTRLEAGSEVDLAEIGAVRLRVEASEPSGGMETAAIFVWERVEVSPYTGQETDQVSHVASPADLFEIPEGSPTLTGNPYFRRTYFDILLRNYAHAAKTWSDPQTGLGVRELVKELLYGLGKLDLLQTVQEEVLADDGDSQGA